MEICELVTKQRMAQNLQPQSCETSGLETVSGEQLMETLQAFDVTLFSMDTVTHVDPIDSPLFAPEFRCVSGLSPAGDPLLSPQDWCGSAFN